MGSVTSNITVAVSLSANEVKVLVSTGEKILPLSKQCNSIAEWDSALRTLFSANKISAKAKVKVVIGAGLYTVAQLPKNENLTDEELHSMAVYKDLEPAVNGQISDYTWDYYEAKTGKNSRAMLNFVLVEKKIIQQIANVINELAVLDSITVHDLAMTSFVSFYQAYSIKKEELNHTGYIQQLCILLYMPKDSELVLYGVHGGELCYSRVLRGYKALAMPGNINGGDMLLSRLVTEILRLSDDFFTSQLGLSQFTRLLLAIDSIHTEQIASVLGESFRRGLEVVMPNAPQNPSTGYTVCDNEFIKILASNSLAFLPLLGELMEGDVSNEKN